MSKSNYAETAVVDWLMGGATPTRPTTRYIAFHTGDPGETGAASEVTATGYVRTVMTFNAASGGAATNASTVNMTMSTAAGTVNYFSIWDAATSGNCLYISNVLGTPRTYGAGDTLTVAAGAITVTEE
jgi:hypothetical protein